MLFLICFGEIKRFIRDDGPVKVSRSIKELAIKIRARQKDYLSQTGEEIKIHQLAEEFNVTREEIAVALDSLLPVESIYEEANSGSGEKKVYKIEKINMQSDQEGSIVERLSLEQAINHLGEKEKKIILLRYYKQKTQTEVAEMLGISQVQVSRIEKKILETMKLKLIS